MPNGTLTARTLSVVVPVYRGEQTVETVVREIMALRQSAATPRGRPYELLEVVLVHDCGPDRSDEALRRLESLEGVQVVWMAKNAGQHAATLAGISATRGEWIVTLDEDGQHDPADIPRLLDAAIETRSHLVYAVGRPPHRLARRIASRAAKHVFRWASGGVGPTGGFSSFRIVLGELARYVGATAGPWVYLDVALTWSISRVDRVWVGFRAEGRPATSYSWTHLAHHFVRMIASLGAWPLRIILIGGIISGVSGFVFASLTVLQRIIGAVGVPGWSSLMAVQLLGFSAALTAVGIVAAFVGVLVTIALGRPAYTVVTDDSIVFR